MCLQFYHHCSRFIIQNGPQNILSLIATSLFLCFNRRPEEGKLKIANRQRDYINFCFAPTDSIFDEISFFFFLISLMYKKKINHKNKQRLCKPCNYCQQQLSFLISICSCLPCITRIFQFYCRLKQHIGLLIIATASLYVNSFSDFYAISSFHFRISFLCFTFTIFRHSVLIFSTLILTYKNEERKKNQKK